MRLLVTGANGQVGSELACSLTALGDVVSFDHHQCDLSRLQRLPGLIRNMKLDVVVNAAAYTAVNEAEDQPARAMKVNAAAAGVLAQEAARAGALFVHYSSDYVFDGGKDGPYREDDPPCPLNVYGHSKLAGENAIRQAGGAWLVLRTGWVYSGARGRNILRTILRVLRERQELRMVANQIGLPASRCEEIHLDWIKAQLRERDELRIDHGRTGAPTSAAEIATATAAIIEAAMRERAEGCFTSGLFHLTAAGATTWHGFAEAVLENAVRHRLAAAADAPRLVPTADDDRLAMLPKHSRLSGDRLAQSYGIILPHWRESLARCLEEEQALMFEPA
jgi:dTDP-4-dehydrorhamnose reductase